MDATVGRQQFCEIFKDRAVVVTAGISRAGPMRQRAMVTRRCARKPSTWPSSDSWPRRVSRAHGLIWWSVMMPGDVLEAAAVVTPLLNAPGPC